MAKPRSLPRAYRSPLYHASWLGAVAVGLALGVLRPSIVTRVQDQLFDAYQRLGPRPFEARTPVRIVDIDDASIAELGQWPWPRTRIAALIGRLREAGAAAIAFDIVFSESDRSSADAFVAGLSDDARRAAVRAALGDVPSNDAVLAGALGAAPVVLGLILTQGRDAVPFAAPYGMAHTGGDPATVLSFSGAVVPLPSLTERAAGLGALNWLPDGDQTVRRVPLLLAFSGRLVPSLAMESLRVAQGASTYLVKVSEAGGALQSVRVGAANVEIMPAGDMRLPFTTHQPERFIPAHRILDGEFDPGAINGRIVVVGSSSAGLTDIRATPVDPAMPGVEIQAQAIEALLTGARLLRPAWPVIELCGGAVATLALAAILPVVPAVAGATVVAFSVAAIVGASWWAYRDHHVLLDPILPGTMMLLAYLGSVSTLFRAEQRDRRFVQDAFGRFVSPAVVARLAREPGLLTLGGESRPLTVMFTDLRNFSAIAERMSPQDLTRFMNRYLSPMSEIVLAHGGTVDKYIGDAIMAFWNAPLPDAAHGEHAARAALAMLDALPDLWADLSGTAEGLPLIRCGIGVASGPCVVGNLGSRLRFDYSALGDDVNLASRLEALTRVYGVDILASEATCLLAPTLAWLEIDDVVVAGRGAPTRISTLLGDDTMAATPAFQAFRKAHGAMLIDYRARRFAAAASAAARLGLDSPPNLTGFYRVYAERCRRYDAFPPPDDWDAVTRMERK